MKNFHSLPLPLHDQIQLRHLNKEHLSELKQLCSECFPIQYPDSWYEEVINQQKFYGIAAIIEKKLVGVIVAEIKDLSRCCAEDRDILSYWCSSQTKVALILILGTSKDCRRKGIGTLLLTTFVQHVQQERHSSCKVVYLHVLASNINAILFYEQLNFKRHKLLLNYYNIRGEKMDGFSYVYYTNNGNPPLTFKDMKTKMTEYLSHFVCCRFSRCLLSAMKYLSSYHFSNPHFKKNSLITV
ncbi:N-alpha-acetyltransferase 60 isoform X2 [Hydra vulgaris]|uniref:N-alpha-acetyltransferase 60 n=1 Tax=Hydra vulgaris TaxID=6087 RepID=A0ABM4CDD7_HYDVU